MTNNRNYVETLQHLYYAPQFLRLKRMGLITPTEHPHQKVCYVGQVIHTYVPLPPSSIFWHWSKGDDALYCWQGNRGLVESTGQSTLGFMINLTCGLTCLVPGSAPTPSPTLGLKVCEYLYPTFLPDRMLCMNVRDVTDLLKV